MGFFSLFNKKNKGFDLPLSDAAKIINVITEADMHAYELSDKELRLEKNDLALFRDIRNNTLNALNYAHNQLKASHMSSARFEAIHRLLQSSLTDIIRLKDSVVSFNQFSDEIIVFVSKSEEAINKYLKDKAHSEAVELRLIRDDEKQIISKASSLQSHLSSLYSYVRSIQSLLESLSNVDSSVIKQSFRKFEAQSNLIKHGLNDVDNVLNNMRRITDKVIFKLQRVIKMDKSLGAELKSFISDAKSKNHM